MYKFAEKFPKKIYKQINRVTNERDRKNKIAYISFMIIEFADAFKMSRPAAYQYLKKYGGLDFLFRHWWAMHTDDRYYGLRDLYQVCLKNGGLR
jgi:hypothetical protein